MRILISLSFNLAFRSMDSILLVAAKMCCWLPEQLEPESISIIGLLIASRDITNVLLEHHDIFDLLLSLGA